MKLIITTLLLTNILTNQIVQKEVDKSLIKPTSYLSISNLQVSNWVPAQHFSQQLPS